MSFINNGNPLYNDCAAGTLNENAVRNCPSFLRQLCRKDEYGFTDYCNQKATNFFKNDVLAAYEDLVNDWLSGNKGANFPKRGWDASYGGRDTNNVLDFCNRANDPATQSKCDNWFYRLCQSTQNDVDAVRYPWCACYQELGYNMAYYDPDSVVFNNPRVKAVSPGGVTTAVPDDPYCFVDKCRTSNKSYKKSTNLKGQAQCPYCVNVVNMENVNFINSLIVQVCDVGSGTPSTGGDGSDYQTNPNLVQSPSSPSSSTSTGLIASLVGIVLFFLLALALVSRKRKGESSKASQNGLRKGLLMSALVASNQNNDPFP